MTGRQTCNGKIMARPAHGLPVVIVVNVTESIEVAVDKQHRLAQPSAIGRSLSVSDVGAIVQIPRIARLESGDLECFD